MLLRGIRHEHDDLPLSMRRGSSGRYRDDGTSRVIAIHRRRCSSFLLSSSFLPFLCLYVDSLFPRLRQIQLSLGSRHRSSIPEAVRSREPIRSTAAAAFPNYHQSIIQESFEAYYDSSRNFSVKVTDGGPIARRVDHGRSTRTSIWSRLIASTVDA